MEIWYNNIVVNDGMPCNFILQTKYSGFIFRHYIFY